MWNMTIFKWMLSLTGNKYYYTDYIIEETVSIKLPCDVTSLPALLCCAEGVF